MNERGPFSRDPEPSSREGGQSIVCPFPGDLAISRLPPIYSTLPNLSESSHSFSKHSRSRSISRLLFFCILIFFWMSLFELYKNSTFLESSHSFFKYSHSYCFSVSVSVCNDKNSFPESSHSLVLSQLQFIVFLHSDLFLDTDLLVRTL